MLTLRRHSRSKPCFVTGSCYGLHISARCRTAMLTLINMKK